MPPSAEPPPPRRAGPGVLRVAALVLERELRETLRDPHVVVYFVFPLFLYPLVVWASVQVALLHEGWTESARWRVDAEGPPEVVAALLEGNEPARGGLDALRTGEADVVVRIAERGRSTRRSSTSAPAPAPSPPPSRSRTGSPTSAPSASGPCGPRWGCPRRSGSAPRPPAETPTPWTGSPRSCSGSSSR